MSLEAVALCSNQTRHFTGLAPHVRLAPFLRTAIAYILCSWGGLVLAQEGDDNALTGAQDSTAASLQQTQKDCCLDCAELRSRRDRGSQAAARFHVSDPDVDQAIEAANRRVEDCERLYNSGTCDTSCSSRPKPCCMPCDKWLELAERLKQDDKDYHGGTSAPGSDIYRNMEKAQEAYSACVRESNDCDASCTVPVPSMPARAGQNNSQSPEVPSAQPTGQVNSRQAEDLQKLTDAAVELVTASVLIAESVRDKRRSREHHVHPSSGDWASKIFTCDSGVNSPGLTGWCAQGDFYGPVHVGAFGVYAHTDGDFFGLGQFAMATWVQNSFYGIVQAGVVNNVVDDFFGIAQIGLANIAGNFFGVGQFGYINSAGTVGFLQVGAVNDADRAVGIQAAAILNRGMELDGIAVGGLGNEHRVVYGMEIGGLLNMSHDLVAGAQIGLINVGGEVDGLQVGLVNYADVLHGVQIGAFNVASHGGLPFMVGLNLGW